MIKKKIQNLVNGIIKTICYFSITYLILVLPFVLLFYMPLLLNTQLDSKLFLYFCLSLVFSLVYFFAITNITYTKNKFIIIFISNGIAFFKSFIIFSSILTFLYTTVVIILFAWPIVFEEYKVIMKFVIVLLTILLIKYSVAILIKKNGLDKYVKMILFIFILSLYNFIIYVINPELRLYYKIENNYDDIEFFMYNLIFRLPNLIVWLFLAFKSIKYFKVSENYMITDILFLGYVGAAYQIIYVIMFGFLPIILSLVAIGGY